ncbi:hypothetical protein [Mucilaginibacter sp.]
MKIVFAQTTAKYPVILVIRFTGWHRQIAHKQSVVKSLYLYNSSISSAR